MIKTEALDPELAEIFCQRFNLPWCMGYFPKRYQRGLYLLIHKYPNDYRPHIIRPIILLEIETNMHNKHLGRTAMCKAKNLDGLDPEQYGTRKSKEEDIQSPNTRKFYDLTRQKRTPATRILTEIVSNYDLLAHSIASL